MVEEGRKKKNAEGRKRAKKKKLGCVVVVKNCVGVWKRSWL